MSRSSESLSSKLERLVNPDEGFIHASVYSDPEIYQLELARIFARSWLLLCPESQIPRPGDYFVSYMGEDPIIVARQEDGSIAAFLNQCRHRGGALCRGESGNAKAFTCTYHGWSYDTTGTLVSIPLEQMIYKRPINKAEWSARRVPRLEVHHGLVFGCWDENAPTFRESLGDAAVYFDLNFGRTEAGLEAYGGVYKWRMKANWKLCAEQFTSDAFHFMTTHTSAVTALVPENPGRPFLSGRAHTSRLGHGGGHFADPADVAALLELLVNPSYAQYATEKEQPQAIARYGQTLGSAYPVFANFFPSVGYLHGNRTLRSWIPRGPDEVEVWAWTLTEKDAPAEIRRLRPKATALTFGPTGIFEQDDTANWVDVLRPLGGVMARQTKLNIQMGQSSQVPGWPGDTDIDASEAGTRNFFRRWLELVSRPNDAIEQQLDGVCSHGR